MHDIEGGGGVPRPQLCPDCPKPARFSDSSCSKCPAPDLTCSTVSRRRCTSFPPFIWTNCHYKIVLWLHWVLWRCTSALCSGRSCNAVDTVSYGTGCDLVFSVNFLHPHVNTKNILENERHKKNAHTTSSIYSYTFFLPVARRKRGLKKLKNRSTKNVYASSAIKSSHTVRSSFIILK